MAKKNFGRFLTFAAIAGAAAAGISYFLQYKSFHKELDEDFHDFEDDSDEFENTDDTKRAAARNYVPLTPDRRTEEEAKTADNDSSGAEEKDAPQAEEECAEAGDSVKADSRKDETVQGADEAADDETIIVEEIKE